MGLNLANINSISGRSGLEILKIRRRSDMAILWEKIVFTSQEFDYTGGIQEFVVPVTGTYQLEVWGAQGGTCTDAIGAAGGKGGYSKGDVYLNEGETIYVVVGGHPDDDSKIGGYNGGGSCSPRSSITVSIGGGGCTHIGTFNTTLASHGNTDGLFIVAGGGGGSTHGSAGGTGGGLTGGNGGTDTDDNDKTYYCAGGTQTGAGTSTSSSSTYHGAFGQGGGGEYSRGGGGGGLYGGSSHNDNVKGGLNLGGGGGSGYIGGVSDGTMENGVQSGNGKAKITLVGSEIEAPEYIVFANGTLSSGVTTSNLTNSGGVLSYDTGGLGTDESETTYCGILDIDLTNHKYVDITLTYSCYVNYGSAYIRYGINYLETDQYTLLHDANASGSLSMDTGVTKTITIDVSAYTGKKPIYFVVRAKNSSSESTWMARSWIKISEIKLYN